MALTITTPPAVKIKVEKTAEEIARPLQNLIKCRYCNYKHWDEIDLRFHEEMHKEYCEEKRFMTKASRIRNDIQ
ncbi:MAG: hypothetical protein M3261_03350 [Thermoproteota archaeon]|nr:hypothetical protein [Thermoproteota archaeon]